MFALTKIDRAEIFRLVWPKEHGSWSLALEPVALGLLAAPSRAGFGLAGAALAAFFLRRPLKRRLQSRPGPERTLAANCVLGLSALAALALGISIYFSGWLQLWPLLPALAAGLVFMALDAQGESRQSSAEVAGAISFALLPATFATLAGWPVMESLALAAVMLARSGPTVLLVRTLLRRAKGEAAATAPALLITASATGGLVWLASRALVPGLTVMVSALLLARAGWYLAARPGRFPARQVGLMELFWGIVVVLTAAIGWHFSFL